MKVTIKDIARETNLSLATISKYLNNKKISSENRQRIEEAIQRLGYKPNKTAQTLRSKHTYTVAIMVPDLGNYFWGPTISAITQSFYEHNYTVITCSFYYNNATETQVVNDLIARHIDGVIFLPYDKTDTTYQHFVQAKIPVVVLDHLPVGQDINPVDCVISDNYQGSAKLAKYLIEKGHKNIYMIGPATNSYSMEQRIEGFCDTCAKHQITPVGQSKSFCFSIPEEAIEHGRRALKELRKTMDYPAAVFFTNYYYALGGLTEASTLDVSIPKDLSVVVFDDGPLFSSMHPPITSVAQDLTQIGITASEILYRRLQKDYSDFPLVQVIPTKMNKRKSVQPLK